MSTKHILVAGSFVFAALPAWAGPAEDALIDKVVQAYGGEAVSSARTLIVRNHNKIIPFGQSAGPDVLDISDGRTELVLDLENRRKSFSSWNKNRAGTFLTQTVFADDAAYTLDHVNKTRTVNQNAAFDAIGGGTVRSVDLTLVYVLLGNRDQAQVAGASVINGAPHSALTFPMEGSPDLTIHVNNETGLISRMTRENPQFGTLSYNFFDHESEGGLMYATQANFQIAGQANTLSVFREIAVNEDIGAMFPEGDDYSEAGAQMDRSEMTVRDLGQGAYYVGQNIGFSIFVDAGDHYVASGGYAALTQRFEALKEHTGVDKPLRYQIVTHHHSDHIGGLGEASALNATMVTVAEHVSPIQSSLESPLPDNRFMLVDGRATLAGGKVEIFDISTVHSSHYLLVYLPELNLIFSADHFSTALEEGLPPANKNMTTFRTAVEALDLDIDGFLGAHGPRLLTMSDLRRATDGYSEIVCPNNATICSD